MAGKQPESHRLEVEALAKKHEAEMAKLKEKHAKMNSPMAVSYTHLTLPTIYSV